MKSKKNYLAFDCGNSSIRIVNGLYDGERIELKLVHQVPNETININGIFYWDILHIFQELQVGLKKAFAKYGHIESVGVSTWGIDFGLLGKSHQLLGNPLCYRNTLGKKILKDISQEDRYKIFKETGIPDHPMNSLYQLMGIRKYLPEYYEKAKKLLLIPDLLVWLFTGEICGEPTIASTTQMMNMRNRSYSPEVIQKHHLNHSLLPAFTAHGKICGNLKQEIADTLKIETCPFISIPSHDTASAVVAVPAVEDDFLFISSGTWSLIGTELEKPIISSDVYAEGFANEGGALGTVTFLKNSSGMYILQKIKKEMEKGGDQYSWDDIVGLAGSCKKEVPIFNPNDYRFYNPPSMSATICEYTKRKLTTVEILASAYFSLACNYRYYVEKIESFSKKKYRVIHIVGGGCKNNYLNQITANITGKIVIAGPNEATSLGNIGIQLKKDRPNLILSQIRKIITKSVSTRSFAPTTDPNVLKDMETYYKKYELL